MVKIILSGDARFGLLYPSQAGSRRPRFLHHIDTSASYVYVMSSRTRLELQECMSGRALYRCRCIHILCATHSFHPVRMESSAQIGGKLRQLIHAKIVFTELFGEMQIFHNETWPCPCLTSLQHFIRYLSCEACTVH